jgi:DNA-directed RNA polymerase specialized sigma24 family protein
VAQNGTQFSPEFGDQLENEYRRLLNIARKKLRTRIKDQAHDAVHSAIVSAMLNHPRDLKISIRRGTLGWDLGRAVLRHCDKRNKRPDQMQLTDDVPDPNAALAGEEAYERAIQEYTDQMTPKQMNIVYLLLENYSIKETAAILNITEAEIRDELDKLIDPGDD